MNEKEPINKVRHFFLDPRSQVGFAMGIMLLYCFVSLIPLARFDSREPSPELQPSFPNQKTQFGEESHLVRTGLYVEAFPGFEIVSNTFILNGIIWFEFDPNVVPLKSIAGFTFEKGTIIEKSVLDMAMVGSQLRVQYRISVKFISDLDHHRFPLGDHRIFLVLTNNLFSSKELNFQALQSGFTVDKGVNPSGWILQDRSVHSGFASVQVNEDHSKSAQSYPRVVYSFDFKKPGFRQALTIIIPLFLIYLLGVFGLIIRSEKDSLSLAVGSISGLMAYRFVIEAISPKVDYLLISDYLNIVFFIAAFLVFLRCAYTHAVTNRGGTEEHYSRSRSVEKANVLLFYIIQVAVLLATIFIVMG